LIEFISNVVHRGSLPLLDENLTTDTLTWVIKVDLPPSCYSITTDATTPGSVNNTWDAQMSRVLRKSPRGLRPPVHTLRMLTHDGMVPSQAAINSAATRVSCLLTLQVVFDKSFREQVATGQLSSICFTVGEGCSLRNFEAIASL
jgi:hypothetical protein